MLLQYNSPTRVQCDSPARASAHPRRRTAVFPWAIAVVAVSGAVLLPWSAYLAATLPPAVTARHWPLAWAGLDGAIAAGLGASAWLALCRDRRLGPVTAATATLMAADAWSDVCTSPAGRPLAMALMGMTVETGVAVTCLLLPRMARPHAAARLAGGPDDGR